MIVNFKEKFAGDKKLTIAAGTAAGALTLLVWFLGVEPGLKLLCAAIPGDDGSLAKALLVTPVRVGYLLFYWAVISWMVYFVAKRFYKGPEGPRA